MKRTTPADVQATVDQIMANSRARFGHGVYRMAKDDPPAEVAPEPFPTGEDLQALAPEALESARADAQAEADTLAEVGAAALTDEQIARINTIGDFLDAVDGEETRRETEAADREAAAAEALARIAPPADSEVPPEGEGEGETPPEGEGEGETPPTAVAAAARVSNMARRQRPAPRPAPAERAPAMTIIAAADLPGVSAGSRLPNMREAAKAFIERSKAFPLNDKNPAPHQYGKHLVASLRRDAEVAFGDSAAVESNRGLRITEQTSNEEMFAILASAANPRRLANEDGSRRGLIAAGGWCAPSETIYDLVAPETLDGIVNLPEVGVSRGGIRFTEGPDFSTIFSSAGFAQTEAEAISGDTKACVEVDCPDFDEVRLDAVGICVKAPLLTNAAFPELVERWLNGTTIANQHKVAGRLLTGMEGTLVATALDYTTSAAGTPFAWGLLSAIELQIEAERQARRLGDDAEMEVILPHWVPKALRADLANRNHQGAESVSHAMVMAHFADIGAMPQFVYNWSGQDLTVDSTNPKSYPTSVKAMIYAAGTFVKGTADVINLSTVYDTAELQTNVYTAAFAEDGVLLAKMRPGGRKILFPVNPNGRMGDALLNDNFGAIQS